MKQVRLSLFAKILLSTSVALTSLFALTAFIMQQYVATTMTRSLEEEVRASFESYDSLWRARAEKLRTVSLILSGMSDVRAAFSTGDQATIRDTAGELWSRISEESAIFLVTDPAGRVIASLGGMPAGSLDRGINAVRTAASQFPNQASGFLVRDEKLYQVVITPVYVQSSQGPALLNVLVSGYVIDESLAHQFKDSTGGSEFLFFAPGRVYAASVGTSEAAELARQAAKSSGESRLRAGGAEYLTLRKPLVDVEGNPIGELCILRSFGAMHQTIAAMRRDILLFWLIAFAAGLVLTYYLARRIIEPVEELDRAAAEVAGQNYDFRVRETGNDELGRLARTFNAMAASIQKARADLIRQERISTIGRLSTSIVHDLRNPLAAIYGGAEMLVDTELSPPQVKRLATNIYGASRRMQEMLQDLSNISRGRMRHSEVCRLEEVIEAAREAVAAVAEEHGVTIGCKIPAGVEIALERRRMERVFVNLFSNAIEAMTAGGAVQVTATVSNGVVTIVVEDTGPGIPEEIRGRLFEPLFSVGKKNGLGLGLALSRQTVLDHGGEMGVEPAPGARFSIRLPLNPERDSHILRDATVKSES